MTDAGDLTGRLRKVKGSGTAPVAPRGKAETTKASVYFDDDEWQQLRRDGFEAGVAVNSIVVAATRLYLRGSADTRAKIIEAAREVTRERRGAP